MFFHKPPPSCEACEGAFSRLGGGMDEQRAFVRGTVQGALAVAGSGLILFLLLKMWEWALGFAVGAALSLGNFHLIVRAVSRLGSPPLRGGGVSPWRGALTRLLVVGSLLYVALRYLRVNVFGLALGLVAVQVGMLAVLLWRGFPADS